MTGKREKPPVIKEMERQNNMHTASVIRKVPCGCDKCRSK